MKKMMRTGIYNSINTCCDVDESEYLELIPDDSDELRIQVKLSVNRMFTYRHEIPKEINKMNPHEFVFMVLDMFQNCEMKPLSEEVVSYVGCPTTKFDFELVYEDTRFYHTELIIMRKYMWQQVDSNYNIESCYTRKGFNYGNQLLKILNRKIPKIKTARSIINRYGKTATIGNLTLQRASYTPPNRGNVIINGYEFAFKDIYGAHHIYENGYYSDDYRENE